MSEVQRSVRRLCRHVGGGGREVARESAEADALLASVAERVVRALGRVPSERRVVHEEDIEANARRLPSSVLDFAGRVTSWIVDAERSMPLTEALQRAHVYTNPTTAARWVRESSEAPRVSRSAAIYAAAIADGMVRAIVRPILRSAGTDFDERDVRRELDRAGPVRDYLATLSAGIPESVDAADEGSGDER